MKSKIFTLYEISPAPYGTDHRVVLIRECLGDLLNILETIEKSNINFESYVILDDEGKSYPTKR